MGGGASDNQVNGEGEEASKGKKEKPKPMEVLTKRVSELREHVSQCSETFLEPRKVRKLHLPLMKQLILLL